LSARQGVVVVYLIIYNMKHLIKIFRAAVFAGVCIGIAGFGFLAQKQLGTFLFIFGLATVVSYRLKLYTGTAGFVRSWLDLRDLALILVGNWVGCALVAAVARCSGMPLQETAQALLESRLALGPWKAGALSIGCGILMTTAVTFSRKGKEFGQWVPLLFAVPLFIVCGFPHCIADAFYYMVCPLSYLGDHAAEVLGLYACLVVGNFIGCNAWRAFVEYEEYA